MTGEGAAQDGPRSGSKRSHTDSSAAQLHGHHEAQQSKRTRVTRACDQCRATRERCDGTKPSCGTCASQSRSCSWNEQPKKRGIQPNYIRTLELTLAWLFRYRPECEAHLTATLASPDDATHRLIGGKDVAKAEALHQSWRNGIVSRQIDQLLSGATVEAGESNASSHLRTSSEGFLALPATPDSTHIAGPSSTNETHAPAVKSTTRPTEWLKLPGNAWTLLEYYFAFTHGWLPFIGKHELLKAMYAFPSQGISFDDSKASEYCELFGVIALSASQLRNGQQDFFKQAARRLLPDKQSEPSALNASATLLLAITDLINGSNLAAWLNIGSVLRLIAFPHPMSKASASSLWDRYKRIRMAAAILENALAAKLRTRAQDLSAQLDQGSFLSEEGDEEWAPWRDPTVEDSTGGAKAPAKSFSTFNTLLRLMPSVYRTPSDSITEPTSQFCDLVFSLLLNSSKPGNRKRPADIVAAHLSLHPLPLQLLQPPTASAQDFGMTGSTIRHKISQSPNLVQPGERMSDIHNQDPSMASDVGPSGPQLGIFDAFAIAHDEFDNWRIKNPATGASLPPQNDDPNQAPDPNLFEEMALLESGDAVDEDHDFLRNLGFGAEIDLALFFGSDYQPSDPFLAYMQPSMFTASQNGNKTVTDIG